MLIVPTVWPEPHVNAEINDVLKRAIVASPHLGPAAGFRACKETPIYNLYNVTLNIPCTPLYIPYTIFVEDKDKHLDDKKAAPEAGMLFLLLLLVRLSYKSVEAASHIAEAQIAAERRCQPPPFSRRLPALADLLLDPCSLVVLGFRIRRFGCRDLGCKVRRDYVTC